MSGRPARILDVGQCVPDHAAIARVCAKLGAAVERAATAAEAIAVLRREAYDLVLINRVLDGDGTSGLDLLRQIRSDPATAGVPVMLVSNYADAQEQAVEAGALPGFGKAALHRPETLERIRQALGR